MLEVASLLQGRPPTSEREIGYVDKRASAIAELSGELRELPRSTASSINDAFVLDPDALVEAREELDQISSFNSVTQLEELIAEARIQRRGRS